MNTIREHFVSALLIATLSVLGTSIVRAETAIGWVDRANIYPGPIIVHARMDSGAKTSSLRVNSSRTFHISGHTSIRMQVTDMHGQVHTLERAVVRSVKIKRHAEPPETRPVITLGICVGKVYQEVEATVVDRGEFNYPLLLGRNFLAGHFLIDSGKTFTIKPACRSVPQ